MKRSSDAKRGKSMTKFPVKAKSIKVPLSRGQKAAATRRANLLKAAEEALAAKLARAARKRKREYQRRAALAWQTRRANLAQKGLITPDGQPTDALKVIRSEIARKAWESRRGPEQHLEMR
jgi:hypothetical protein